MVKAYDYSCFESADPRAHLGKPFLLPPPVEYSRCATADLEAYVARPYDRAAPTNSGDDLPLVLVITEPALALRRSLLPPLRLLTTYLVASSRPPQSHTIAIVSRQ